MSRSWVYYLEVQPQKADEYYALVNRPRFLRHSLYRIA